MAFARRKVAAGVACALGIGGVVSADQAVAQDVRVEVTGSSIRRVEAEGALPVQVFTRSEIERTGATSTAELMQSLPVFQGFTTQSDSVGGGGAGFAGAGLRNQGEERTLVLLNGKRLAPSGTQALTGAQAAVNINNIPLVAIERVEILTDGASALYGADAIGGVVNFITRRDVSYGEIQLGGQLPEGSDGKEWNFSATKGFGTLEKDGWNVLISASYDKRDPLKSIDRSYAKSGLFDFTEGGRLYQFQFGSPSPIPANVTAGSTLFSPIHATTGTCAPNTFFLDDICQYDFTSQLEIYPEQERRNALFSFTTKLGDNHQFSVDYIYSKSETISRLAPPPGSFNITSTSPLWPEVLGYLDAAGVPVPANNRVTARYRVADVGKRTTEDVSEANHISAELKGTIEKWDYAASYTRSESKYESNLLGGWVQQNPFLAALNSGLVNPFVGPGQQSAAGQALLDKSIMFGYWDGGTTTIDYIDVHATRPVFKLGGGDAQLALGGSWLKEDFESLPSNLEQGFDDNGNPDTRFGDSGGVIPYSANRSSWAVYAEMLLPITKEFEITPSIRYDDYEDFGNTTNYKIALRWQPTKQLLFRGSYGTGFKAPTVPQLNAAAQSFGVTGNAYSCNQDPRLQAQATRLGAECPAGGNDVQFDQIAGGNRALEPETSKQWTIGTRWEPTPQFGMGVDVWEVKIDNTIGQIDESTVFGDPDKYPQGFTTFVEPSTGLLLLAYFGSNVNLGKSKTQGLDFDITYRAPFTGGNYKTTLFGTWIWKNEYEVVPGQGFFDDVGKFINGGVTFPFKAKWVHSLDWGNWEHTLAINYLAGYEDDRDNSVFDYALGDYVTLERRVSHYTTADWQTRWRFAKNWTLTAGIWNMFSTRPPLSLTTNGGGQMIGYNADFSDSRDRTFYANINFKF